MNRIRRTVTAAVLAAALAALALLPGASAATAVIQPAPWQCGVSAKTAACTTWKNYMDTRQRVLNLNTRRAAVTGILAASGTKSEALAAGAASVKAGRCNQVPTNGALALLDETYRRGAWANQMAQVSKLVLEHTGGQLVGSYSDIAERVNTAARKTGLNLYASAQSRVVISNWRLCR